MKIIKVKIFRIDDYHGKTCETNGNLSLDQWQEENPDLKIIDTKINSTEKTYIENLLLVTYEENQDDKKS